MAGYLCEDRKAEYKALFAWTESDANCLPRTTLHRHQRRFPEAQTDLDKVFDISHSEMLLDLTDYHLESSRLALAQNDIAKAREHFVKAKELVEKTGYHRRDGEVREIGEKVA